MAEITQSLFGITPEAYQQAQNQALQAEALKFAQLDPMQQAQMGAYMAGSRLGNVFGGLLGAEDPTLQKIKTLQSIMSSGDTTTFEGQADLARKLGQAGFAQQALQMAQSAQSLREQTAKAGTESNKLAMEMQLRDELSKLSPDASEEDILKVVTKYGSPDKVLAAIQSSQAKREALKSSEQRAQDANNTRLMIAQMQNDTRQLMATAMMGMKQGQIDEKSLAADQQRLGAIASFDTSISSLDELSNHPGKSAAVGVTGKLRSLIPGTDAYGFAQKLETFKAQTFVPMVSALKGMGALSDAEGKKLTDAVGALDQGMKESEFNSQMAKIKKDLAVSMERAKMAVKNKSLIQPFMDVKNQVTAPTASEQPASAGSAGWSIKVK